MPHPLPPLNPLRAFEVAARHLSFTRASEELFVTPSAVSHQVRTLEESLGVALFIRDAKQLALTAAGKAYLPGVQEAFRQMALATYQLRRAQAAPALKIDLPPTFAVKWLIPRLARFLAMHPHIDVRVSTLRGMVDFSRDDVDLALRYGHGVYPGLHAERCFDVEVFPVCSPRLREGAQPLAVPADLRHHVLLHDDSTYDDVSNPNWAVWLARAGVEGVDASRGPSFSPSHLVVDAAIDGLGVALAKNLWVRRALAEGRLVRPFPGPVLAVEFSYFLICPKDRADDPRIRAFAAWLHAERQRDEAEDAATLAPAAG